MMRSVKMSSYRSVASSEFVNERQRRNHARRSAAGPVLPARLLTAAAILAATVSPSSAEPAERSLPEVFAAVVERIEAETDTMVTSRWRNPIEDGRDLCDTTTYCFGFLGDLRIEALGRTIEIMPHPQTPPEIVAQTCIALLSTFVTTGTRDMVEAFVLGAMSRVVELEESVEAEFDHFRYETKLTSEHVPDCRVIRYRPVGAN